MRARKTLEAGSRTLAKVGTRRSILIRTLRTMMLDAHQESARIAVLRSYRILDTDADPAFDRITGLAATLFHVPIALVSLIDVNRQWFKSCVGVSSRETDRDVAFCAHAIHSDEPLVIDDARDDARFRDNPMVTGEPFIRFYAGAPLVTPGGYRLGTLCLADKTPRKLTTAEIETLKTLSKIVVDMLELNVRRSELAVARNEMSTILDSMDEFVVAVDTAGQTVRFNNAAQTILGAERMAQPPAMWFADSRVLKADRVTVVPPSERPLARALRGETVRGEVMCLETPDRPVRLYSVNVSPLRDANDDIVGSVSVGRDVTEEERLRELERASARTDALTSLGNRRALEDIAPHALARADRDETRPVSIALFDLDHFKRINDTFGHEVGDVVLREVARALRSIARAGDVLVRWGGEELLALLPDCDHEGARQFATRACRAVEKLEIPHAGKVTTSAGVAVRAPREELSAVIARADAQLYRAKHNGRNRVE